MFYFRPSSLLTSINAYGLFFILSMLTPSRFTSSASAAADMSHSISVPSGFWTFLKEYAKASLKCSGDKASPCFRPLWIGKQPENIYLHGLY
jgi:hypothetical protein